MTGIIIFVIIVALFVLLFKHLLNKTRGDAPTAAEVIGNLSPGSGRIIILKGNGAFDIDIVGESNYQAELEALAGGRDVEGADFEVSGVLMPEPNNPYDPNAIRVVVGGRTIGYIPKRETAAYHAVLGGRPAQVQILIVGGWDRGKRGSGHFGAKLDVAWPPSTTQ